MNVEEEREFRLTMDETELTLLRGALHHLIGDTSLMSETHRLVKDLYNELDVILQRDE